MVSRSEIEDRSMQVNWIRELRGSPRQYANWCIQNLKGDPDTPLWGKDCMEIVDQGEEECTVSVHRKCQFWGELDLTCFRVKRGHRGCGA